MKKVLVIGASGFVGGYLSRQLLSDGYKVRCLARNTAKVQSLANSGCEIVKGDITNLQGMEQAFKSIGAV